MGQVVVTRSASAHGDPSDGSERVSLADLFAVLAMVGAALLFVIAVAASVLTLLSPT